MYLFSQLCSFLTPLPLTSCPARETPKSPNAWFLGAGAPGKSQLGLSAALALGAGRCLLHLWWDLALESRDPRDGRCR